MRIDNMWFPSFVSVLHDLWQFCIGRSKSTNDLQPVGAGLAYQARPAVTVPASNPVQQLQSDTVYGSDHVVTRAIRSDLHDYDPHLVQNSFLTLPEWLMYIIHRKNPAVPLLVLQLTPVGRWHTTLKGQSVATVGVTPYSDAIMEWYEKGEDQAALVLQVTPDETVTVGELGKTQSGLYSKRTLSKLQWLELRPVFTTFA